MTSPAPHKPIDGHPTVRPFCSLLVRLPRVSEEVHLARVDRFIVAGLLPSSEDREMPRGLGPVAPDLDQRTAWPRTRAAAIEAQDRLTCSRPRIRLVRG